MSATLVTATAKTPLLFNQWLAVFASPEIEDFDEDEDDEDGDLDDDEGLEDTQSITFLLPEQVKFVEAQAYLAANREHLGIPTDAELTSLTLSDDGAIPLLNLAVGGPADSGE